MPPPVRRSKIPDKRQSGTVWTPITLIGGIVYPMAMIVINKKLPIWTNYNPNHPLASTITGTTTLLGLLVLFGLCMMMANRKRNKDYVSVVALIVGFVLSLICGFLLLVSGQTWYGLYKIF